MANNSNGKTKATGTGKPTKPLYTPNWDTLETEWATYASEGGKGYVEARRHRLALKAPIRTMVRDPLKRAHRFKSLSKAYAHLLGYMNPSARLLYCGQVVRGFCALQPAAPLFAVTVIGDAFNFSTTDKSPLLRPVKAIIEGVLEKAGANAFGHVEYAVFPKTKVGDGYRIAAHGQFVAWGISPEKLKAALKRIFRPLDDGTPGFKVIPITRTFCNVVSYLAKAPTYGYSGWPRMGSTQVHKPVEIPQRGHFQLLNLFSRAKWPDFIISVGDGKKIERSARRMFGLPVVRASNCPSADNSVRPHTKKKEAKRSEVAYAPLTFDTIFDAKTMLRPDMPALQEQAAEAGLAFQKYLGQKSQAKADLYAFLNMAFTTALVSTTREDELRALVMAKGLTFNRNADLMALAIKVIVPTKNYNRRRASDWAAALRYLLAQDCKPGDVATYFSKFGGTKACADAVRAGRKRLPSKPPSTSPPNLPPTSAPDTEAPSTTKLAPTRPNPPEIPPTATPASDDDWKIVKKFGRRFSVATNDLKMPMTRGILFAGRNKDHNRLIVRHAISSRSPEGRKILEDVAALLKERPPKRRK